MEQPKHKIGSLNEKKKWKLRSRRNTSNNQSSVLSTVVFSPPECHQPPQVLPCSSNQVPVLISPTWQETHLLLNTNVQGWAGWAAYAEISVPTSSPSCRTLIIYRVLPVSGSSCCKHTVSCCHVLKFSDWLELWFASSIWSFFVSRGVKNLSKYVTKKDLQHGKEVVIFSKEASCSLISCVLFSSGVLGTMFGSRS